MKAEINRLPSWKNGVWNVWKRNFLDFRRAWIANILWIWLEPLCILLALGYGLGSYIPSIQGVSYADFFFPALLCFSSMLVSFYSATYEVFSKMHIQKTYSTILLTPVTSDQLVIGELLWSASKGTMSALSVSVVAGIFGHIETVLYLPAIAVVFLSSFLFAGLGMVIAAKAKNTEFFIYPMSLLIVPMSLFSGTYFPIDQFPFGTEYLAYILPLTHAVAAVRGLLLESAQWWVIAIHAVVLLLAGLVVARLAMSRFDIRKSKN